MTMGNIILLLGFLFPVIWSAGPNTVMCASIGGRYGVTKLTPFVLGSNGATLIHSIIIGFGFGTLFEAYPEVFSVLKYLGIVYIFYIGWRIFSADTGIKKTNDMPGFLDGFIVNILNVKLIVVIALTYSQFLNIGSNKIMQIGILTTSIVLLCAGSQFAWAIAGSAVSKLFISPKALKIQNYTFGTMLFMVGIWLFLK